MTALADLIARVEGLKGPDRNVDAEIVAHLRILEPHHPEWLRTNFAVWRARPDGRVETVRDDGTGDVHWEPKLRLTASLDAVVALIDRELPGWAWSLHSWAVAAICEDWDDDYAPSYQSFGNKWKPAKHTPFEKWKPEPKAATPALALLLAFLRALEASRPPPGPMGCAVTRAPSDLDRWLEVAADAVREHDAGDIHTETGWASDDLCHAWQACNSAAAEIAKLRQRVAELERNRRLRH